ncbi:MAG: tRNA (guanosine(37)-N1)-methyltransferase TrmD [Pseudomonadota bacterium]
MARRQIERVTVVTLFPQLVQAVAEHGVVGRAIGEGAIRLACENPRDFATDKHRRVDDRPFGGGPGMVMQFAPVVGAIRAARAAGPEGARVVLLSPQGERFSHDKAVTLGRQAHLILVAGRYEGLDERIVESEIDEELSLGDFVLSGGELAAMAVVDSVVRLLPGTLGHAESAVEDSYSTGLLDHPHYTRPASVEGLQVPEVLQSGDHAAIERWRRQQRLGRTWLRRPDLLEVLVLSDEDKALLEAFKASKGDGQDHN